MAPHDTNPKKEVRRHAGPLIGISAVLHGLMTLNPFEIGLGAAEIGDGLGRYMQLGRAFEKGPPPITPSAPV